MENNTALIPISQSEVNSETINTVNARDLHSFLEVGKVFGAWITERIEQFGFAENQDFVVFSESGKNPLGGRPTKDYHLTLDMAKELSMVERNEKGKEARKYFIECERVARTGSYQLPHTIKALPGKLSCESQDLIKAAVRERLASVPAADRGIAARTIWGALNTKFGTKGIKDGYKNIPDEAVDECLSLVARVPLRREAEELQPARIFTREMEELFKAQSGGFAMAACRAHIPAFDEAVCPELEKEEARLNTAIVKDMDDWTDETNRRPAHEADMFEFARTILYLRYRAPRLMESCYKMAIDARKGRLIQAQASRMMRQIEAV